MFKVTEENRSFIQHILGDTMVATALFAKNPESQFLRRTYVRTFIAWCEGYTDLVRTDLIGNAEAGQIQLDMATLTILKEKSVSIGETGKVEADSKNGFYRTLNLFAFTMRTLLTTLDEDPDRFFGDNGWASFRDALCIRDKLAHPKMKKDLEISDIDFATVLNASEFIFMTISRHLGIDTKSLPDVDFRLRLNL